MITLVISQPAERTIANIRPSHSAASHTGRLSAVEQPAMGRINSTSSQDENEYSRYIFWWLCAGRSSILLASASRQESLFVDNPILQKTIITVVFVLWVINEFRTKKKKHSDPAIEEADARERHEWRYLRWGGRAIQLAAIVFIFVQLMQFLLR